MTREQKYQSWSKGFVNWQNIWVSIKSNFMAILIVVLLEARQACSSYHQIFIWICFSSETIPHLLLRGCQSCILGKIWTLAKSVYSTKKVHQQMELFRKTPRIKFLIKFLTRREGKASHGVAFKIERHPKLSFQSSFWWEENEKQVLVSTGSPLLSIYSGNAGQYLSLKVLGQFEGIVGRIKSQSCRCNWCSDANQWI